MVVWVDAAAELSTMSISSLDITVPKPDEPKIELPSTLNTSAELSSLPNPIPLSPTPAKAWAATETSA